MENISDYYADGVRAYRIPFLWGRIQRSLGSELSQEDLYGTDRIGGLDRIVTTVLQQNGFAVLDLRDQGTYRGRTIRTESGVTKEFLADVWVKIFNHFGNSPNILLSIMNEPLFRPTNEGLDTTDWVDIANHVISELRSAGSTQIIVVQGNQFSSARSWGNNSEYGTSNNRALLALHDPLNNLLIDVHNYADANGSGTSPTCVSDEILIDRLNGMDPSINPDLLSPRDNSVTVWLRQNNFRAIVGEFGGSSSSTCLQAMENMAEFVDKNSDVYAGYFFWGAGSFDENYELFFDAGHKEILK